MDVSIRMQHSTLKRRFTPQQCLNRMYYLIHVESQVLSLIHFTQIVNYWQTHLVVVVVRLFKSPDIIQERE